MLVDPRAGAACAAGTLTLPPGEELPTYRLLDEDVVLVAYKGQGRAVVNDRAIGVVPGTILHVPRGVWHTLRNTGTGTLQMAWVSPPGLSEFWREASSAGSLSAAVLQQAAQRHKIELREAATDAPASAVRRGRRGGRGRHGRGLRPTGSSESPAAPPLAGAQPSAVAPAAPEASAAAPVGGGPVAPNAPAGPQRRRHRRGGRGRGRSSAPPAVRSPQAGPAPAAAPAPKPQPSSRPGARRQQPSQRRRGRVKEVYMGGQWVRVEGGGSVIDLGARRRRAAKPRRDDDPPNIRLSVPL